MPYETKSFDRSVSDVVGVGHGNDTMIKLTKAVCNKLQLKPK